MTDIAHQRPVYLVCLRPEPGVDGVKALRAFLKTAVRRFGLRALSVDAELAECSCDQCQDTATDNPSEPYPEDV
jgi:hypothetical protein